MEYGKRAHMSQAGKVLHALSVHFLITVVAIQVTPAIGIQFIGFARAIGVEGMRFLCQVGTAWDFLEPTGLISG